MAKANQAQNILSFVGVKLYIKHKLIVSLISAFFIASCALILANFSYSWYSNYPINSNTEEKVGFIPNMYITQALSKGYLGR